MKKTAAEQQIELLKQMKAGRVKRKPQAGALSQRPAARAAAFDAPEPAPGPSAPGSERKGPGGHSESGAARGPEFGAESRTRSAAEGASRSAAEREPRSGVESHSASAAERGPEFVALVRGHSPQEGLPKKRESGSRREAEAEGKRGTKRGRALGLPLGRETWRLLKARQRETLEFKGRQEMGDWAAQLLLALPPGAHALGAEARAELFRRMRAWCEAQGLK